MKVQDLFEDDVYKVLSVNRLKPAAAVGTSKQGTVQASFDELVNLFGNPISHGPDHDTAHEWVLKFRVLNTNSFTGDVEPVIVTIYDRFNHENPEEVTRWEVGGKNRTASWILDDYLAQMRK